MDGNCNGMFTRSCADLSAMCFHYGIQLQYYFLFNESLITRARNYCCESFMKSDCTHLIFIDSDIGFKAQDVIATLALSLEEDKPYDVLVGAYPKKCISWEKIKMAVDKGFADENPNNLENFVGDYVFNPKQNTGSFRLDEPVEILEGGTGFMMIRRNTLDKFRDAMPQYLYRPDHIRSEGFDGSVEIMQYFQAEIDPVDKRYLSEDYWFSRKIQELGMSIYLCPWIQLVHAGSYVFGGSLQAMAALGTSPTADVSLLKKTKK